jgi:polyhydroxyalkanoate synthesis regulator phasin
MHRTTRRWVTGAAALSAGVFMIGPVTAFAQSPDPGGSTTTTAPATSTPAKRQDVSTVIKDVLDNLVKAGAITQAQADAVTKALQDALPKFEQGPGRRGGPFGRFGAGLALDAAAKVLGITADELRTELQSGKTIAEIAKAHGIDVQKVIDGLAADAKTKLDAAVKAGKLTQEQADARLKKMTDRLTKLVNQQVPMLGGGNGGWGHRGGGGQDEQGTTEGGSAPTPAPTPTTGD